MTRIETLERRQQDMIRLWQSTRSQANAARSEFRLMRKHARGLYRAIREIRRELAAERIGEGLDPQVREALSHEMTYIGRTRTIAEIITTDSGLLWLERLAYSRGLIPGSYGEQAVTRVMRERTVQARLCAIH